MRPHCRLGRADIWNESAHAEIAAPNTAVTVTLNATYHSVAVYDPLQGAAPIQTFTDVNKVSLNVTDHPLIVEVIGQERRRAHRHHHHPRRPRRPRRHRHRLLRQPAWPIRRSLAAM